MERFMTRGAVGILLLLIALLPLGPVAGLPSSLPPACGILAFSTEEDFITLWPEPPGGNPIISDGDLLALETDAAGNVRCLLCARNAELLQSFDITNDLGLDAVDVLDAETYLVAFSTELDGPTFTQGDLLVISSGGPVVILNQALTDAFGAAAPAYDIGLDAVHFVGTLDEIVAFLNEAAASSPVDPDKIGSLFEAYPGVDILYSTEGTPGPVEGPVFLDGDLLSARLGTIVAANSALLPATVPAGVPDRGVDFGLDAATAGRNGSADQIHFSTEILFEGEPSFTDGDVLLANNGVVLANRDLVWCFQPMAEFLGLDALHMALEPITGEVQGRKFHDLDADGVPDADDPGLADWEIHLDGQDQGGNPVSQVTQTNSTGVYSFTVPAGTYTISETCPVGAAWHQSHPLPTDDVCGTGVHTLNVAPGDPPHTGLDFGNYQYASKSGSKFEDLDRNGAWDADDPPLVEWEIHLEGTDGLGNGVLEVTHTNANGYYSFSVPPGSYTVYEVCPLNAGWRQTLPATAGDCGSGVYPFNPASGDEPHEGNDFGNYQVQWQYLPVVLRNFE
jgi:hypothetical protein